MPTQLPSPLGLHSTSICSVARQQVSLTDIQKRLHHEVRMSRAQQAPRGKQKLQLPQTTQCSKSRQCVLPIFLSNTGVPEAGPDSKKTAAIAENATRQCSVTFCRTQCPYNAVNMQGCKEAFILEGASGHKVQGMVSHPLGHCVPPGLPAYLRSHCQFQCGAIIL